MKRAVGFGGAFFKAKDPQTLTAWYEKHLGVPFGGNQHVVFSCGTPNTSLVFSAFPADTDYFAPSDKPFMFNFRVENLHELLKVLKEEGVQVIDKTEDYPYGKFGWIVDPEGNKVELWEPAAPPSSEEQS